MRIKGVCDYCEKEGEWPVRFYQSQLAATLEEEQTPGAAYVLPANVDFLPLGCDWAPSSLAAHGVKTLVICPDCTPHLLENPRVIGTIAGFFEEDPEEGLDAPQGDYKPGADERPPDMVVDLRAGEEPLAESKLEGDFKEYVYFCDGCREHFVVEGPDLPDTVKCPKCRRRCIPLCETRGFSLDCLDSMPRVEVMAKA